MKVESPLTRLCSHQVHQHVTLSSGLPHILKVESPLTRLGSHQVRQNVIIPEGLQHILQAYCFIGWHWLLSTQQNCHYLFRNTTHFENCVFPGATLFLLSSWKCSYVVQITTQFASLPLIVSHWLLSPQQHCRYFLRMLHILLS